MVIKVITNSVGTKYNIPYPYKTFPELIGGETHYAFMAVGALSKVLSLNIKEDDLIIFNIGVNDCIFRKDKVIQLDVLNGLMIEAELNKDYASIKFLSKKILYVLNKKPDELFQILNFEEFEFYIDKMFSKVSKGIVLSVLWVNPKSKIIGWGCNEIIQTNNILKKKANQYGFEYIDLFYPPSMTFDDVHLTEEGHKYVAQQINARFK
jgi:lysophospholipase L1-like esterase